MQISFKRFTLIFLIIVILAGGYFIFKEYLPHSPYPSLNKQRAALKHKPFVIPFRVLDSAQIVDDLKFLASDSCEGRRPGSTGHDLAIARILSRIREADLDSFNSSVQQFSGRPLYFKSNDGHTDYFKKGQNIIGWIKGTEYPEKYIVISAHYDHIGRTKDGKIYPGASDNASGVACLLAMAKFFRLHPLPFSLIIAAFDREESWMEGSGYFVKNPPVSISKIKFNLNIDMIARNENNEIYACGVYHQPFLKYIIAATQNKTNSKLLMGHDHGNGYREDWTGLSDQDSFNDAGIPFLYIGTEDHPDLHQTTDTFEKIDLSSYIENCNMMVLITQALDPVKFPQKK